MLPIGEALIDHLTRTGVIGADIRSVVGGQPTGSALPDIESSGVRVYAGVFQPPARCTVLRPLLTPLRVAPWGLPR